MNKDLKARVETTIITARHVCNNEISSMCSPVPDKADIIYLLEKIEDLQVQVDVLKSKRKVK